MGSQILQGIHSFLQERRIQRLHFFIYFVVLFTIVSTISYLSSSFIQITESESNLFVQGLPLEDPWRVFYGNMFWLVLYGFGYFVLYILLRGRYYDIGWGNRSPKILISTFLLINLWSFGLGAYSAFFGNPVNHLIESNYWLSIFASGIGFCAIGALIGIIIMIFLGFFLPSINNDEVIPSHKSGSKI